MIPFDKWLKIMRFPECYIHDWICTFSGRPSFTSMIPDKTYHLRVHQAMKKQALARKKQRAKKT
jgi:hypothetical protein